MCVCVSLLSLKRVRFWKRETGKERVGKRSLQFQASFSEVSQSREKCDGKKENCKNKHTKSNLIVILLIFTIIYISKFLYFQTKPWYKSIFLIFKQRTKQRNEANNTWGERIDFQNLRVYSC